ncbi:multidrug transporter, variant 3 [Coprinopsis cinerea AmutBmut pab1-1]|nr:multidrug transporter, variant 3 [Coprinopsis cinerea AmutBmut pab1-1]
MESTPAVISLAISISIFAFAIGAIIGATYAGFYGRRSVYLFSLPVLLLGSTGVSLAQSVPELMVWRFIQAMGAGPGGSVGAGTIGDIYKLEERGRAMSVYFLACLLGVALAPLAGGYAAHYASWRLMQLGLGCIGFALWFAVLLWLPETSHPGTRGIEKIDAQSLPRWRPVILNPLRPLALLRSPVMLSIALVTACSLYVYQVLLIPLSYTLGARYGITNEAIIGLCFLVAGLGNMLGTPIIGYICDMTVIKWKNKRNGVWCPEDRLRPAQIPLLVIVPVSCFLSGLFSRYGTGALGLSLNLLCLFFNGFGLEMVWGPCAAYLVDVAHSRSAESVAANA